MNLVFVLIGIFKLLEASIYMGHDKGFKPLRMQPAVAVKGTLNQIHPIGPITYRL